nr:unnamed protein product [Meloidogyne enterolobii]CAD2200379.1 unnamed protein product [Meloidogyne enterolobii]
MAPATIPSCCLTAEQKDILIDAVHVRPVIWDCSIPDYQDVQNRRAAFAEVAEILSDDKSKYSGPEMQVEWKKLRDIFNRTLKKVVANGGSDSEITWRYWQKLQFIADHERTQIYKAMQKWSKKVPSSLSLSPPIKSNFNNLKRRSSNNYVPSQSTNNRRFNKISDGKRTTSMVQQLAEVAQTARELLGIETKKEEIEEFKEEINEEEEKYKLINEDGEIIDEDGREEEKGNNCEAIEQQQQKINSRKQRMKEFNTIQEQQQRPIDTIGQMLLLGSQLQNSSFNGIDCSSIGNDTNPTSTTCTTTELNKTMDNNDLPKLLNELLSRGTEIIETTKECFGRTKWPINSQIKNEGTKRPRVEEQLKNEWNYCNGNNIKTEQHQSIIRTQKQTSVSDQFDVFGMFIASQLRTLHSHSPQSAFTLKRALTGLCFQFEAEQKESEGKNKFNF